MYKLLLCDSINSFSAASQALALEGQKPSPCDYFAPVMLQTGSGFHDMAQNQNRCWPPSWFSWTCLPTMFPLAGQHIILPLPQGQTTNQLLSLFWRKIATISDNLNLQGIISLPLRKGCQSGHPSPLQALGPTLDFCKQISAAPHQVTVGRDRSLVLLLSVLCMVTSVHCSKLCHVLLRPVGCVLWMSQDIHNHCVIGWECCDSTVS